MSNQRDYMIIELDGYFHQVLLAGKKCSKQELQQKYRETKEYVVK
ncbi:hypothetical protein [Bacillus seohaeanensis]|jgi:hypothetical protein|uniref:Fur-regulated basic protein FbpA n=1 Tax=Bacillus seohaeanensis TaxID=284580 RepID=A0ABW5RQS7_9BACI